MGRGLAWSLQACLPARLHVLLLWLPLRLASAATAGGIWLAFMCTASCTILSMYQVSLNGCNGPFVCAGGLGLAAVQVASALGGVPLGTAGSSSKRAFLRGYWGGVHSAVNSRTTGRH